MSALRVAIVGSGPSGFYAAEALLRSGQPVEVDVFDRLPVPYGLVRSGVAPDHPKLKEVTQVFARIGTSPHFRFFGNVAVGSDIPVEVLQTCYHAVIIACGAETDRRLGIPGENLPGSHTATEFVGWYNGHPAYADRTFDLSHRVAAIFGHGNVAADVARILAKTTADLERTDIAQHALEAMRESRITDIHVIGRRGPVQAKFTSKELKEFGELEHCQPVVDPQALVLNPESEAELADKSNSGGRLVYDLFQGFSRLPRTNGKHKRVHFHFLRSPIEILGSNRVEAVRLGVNTLSGSAFNQSARGTGSVIEIEAGIVFRSIGYRGLPLPGVPFDDHRGVIPNTDGRVMDANGLPLPGLYVTGWIKRGPTGIIGTNRADSVATVKSLIDDLPALSATGDKPGNKAAAEHLARHGVRYLDFAEWLAVDRSEIARGAIRGKPREKYIHAQEILEFLGRD